ncbi:hypothetical protein IFM89_023795 [Coptis chinensis]|uniref:Late embryogenesis abundant protein LEA-2 subgroup domain-containing protein n=1 Tax=Coptis chinensis TaxID=261450 RepID=A0A835HLM7_9MAGN|nr:hypothetical protein IFM89_023795 [Coptis chinensis]
MADEPPTPTAEVPQTKDTAPNNRLRIIYVVILLVLVGAAALAGYLVFRPHKPHFMVEGVAIYELNTDNTTTPMMMSAKMQFTVVTRNPNKYVGIYYDPLSAYVTYRNQQITPTVMFPFLFQETKTTVGFSPIIGGGIMPVSVEVANGLVMDQANGVVPFRLIFTGRVKYKAVAITTKHALCVKCDVTVGLKEGVVGQVPLLGAPECTVDI